MSDQPKLQEGDAGHWSARPPPPRSRWQRFVTTRYWLVLKNILGWVLILAAFVAGPLVPGPGGIPLFLIGFALISFPGKRRLTARVLRGIPVRFPGGPFVLISLLVALALPVILLSVAQRRSEWLATRLSRGPLWVGLIYVISAASVWLLARYTPHVLNVLLRLVARGRRKFRPWLRHHHIRLLPPRWRVRLGHERGIGPFRLTEEILKYGKKKSSQQD